MYIVWTFDLKKREHFFPDSLSLTLSTFAEAVFEGSTILVHIST